MEKEDLNAVKEMTERIKKDSYMSIEPTSQKLLISCVLSEVPKLLKYIEFLKHDLEWYQTVLKLVDSGGTSQDEPKGGDGA